MPRYPYELGEPDRLEITWTGLFNDVVVSLDGAVVWRIAKLAAKDVATNTIDGAELRLFRNPQRSGQLCVHRDGAPLPGSFDDPRRVRQRVLQLGKFATLGSPLFAIIAWWSLQSPPGPPARIAEWVLAAAVSTVITFALGVWGFARRSPRALHFAATAFLTSSVYELSLLWSDTTGYGMFISFLRLAQAVAATSVALVFTGDLRRAVAGVSPVAALAAPREPQT